MGSNLPTHLPSNSSTNVGITKSLLRVKGLCKQYVRVGLWTKRVRVAAVRCVDFEIPRGQTLALVGESGSGKSPVARCGTRPERPDSGQTPIHGAAIPHVNARH